jgi:hypothetical protein
MATLTRTKPAKPDPTAIYVCTEGFASPLGDWQRGARLRGWRR